ncbi:MAG: hypothetical protein RL385_44 [Pseudomonadota bacterium]|jgi:hypothetical protein
MSRTLLAIGLTALLGAAFPALAAEHEVYAVSGAGYLSSPSRLLAGVGGGPGYRLHLTPALAVHTEVRWLGLLGNAWSISAGGIYSMAMGPWRPGAGLQITGFLGDQVRIVSSTAPDPVSPFGVSLQARFVPLRFEQGSAQCSVLGFDLGGGIDHGHASFSLLFSLLEIGYRF